MAQITVTISDEQMRALQAEARRRNISVDAMVAELVRSASVTPRIPDDAWAIVEAAQAHSLRTAPALTEGEAMELAVAATRKLRAERAAGWDVGTSHP